MKTGFKSGTLALVICICLLSLCGCGSSKKEKKDIPGTYSETKLHFDDNVSRITLKNGGNLDRLDIEDKGLINEIVSRLNALPLDDKKSETDAYSGWVAAMEIYVEGEETPYNLNITDDHINSYQNWYYLNGEGSELQDFRIFLYECINLNKTSLTDVEEQEMSDPKVKQEYDEARLCLNDYVDVTVVSVDETGMTYTVKENKTFDLWDDEVPVKDDHYNSLTLDDRYTLEVMTNDQWIYAKYCLPVTDTLIVPPGNIYHITKEGIEITTKWEMFGSLPSGHYRLKKWVNPYNGEKFYIDALESVYISIEFDIE